MRMGKHYLVTSGTTGYLPNPSEIAVADTWHGPYRVLGNPHPADLSNTSFHSQISSVFRVSGKKDLYIACADRWVPDEMHLEYDTYKRFFELAFHPDEKEREKVKDLDLDLRIVQDTARNTSISDYVWLPLRFEGEMAYIDWLDEWRIEDYE